MKHMDEFKKSKNRDEFIKNCMKKYGKSEIVYYRRYYDIKRNLRDNGSDKKGIDKYRTAFNITRSHEGFIKAIQKRFPDISIRGINNAYTRLNYKLCDKNKEVTELEPLQRLRFLDLVRHGYKITSSLLEDSGFNQAEISYLKNKGDISE